MNISVPESMKKFVEEKIQKDGYGTASEYVRELIREDQKRDAEQQLHDLLLKGLNSPKTEVNDELWAHIRQQVEERFAKQPEQ